MLDRIQNLLSRKFIFAILALSLVFVAFIMKSLTAEQFIDAVKWLGITFIGSQAIQNTIASFSENEEKEN